MAVDDYLFRETDSLVLPPKTLYPLSIPVAHYQLRHYISCDEQDILYYASGQDVFALNAATRRRTHIATVPFETRCTASGHGWLCLGGEDEGHFAAIKLDGGASLAADVDALLPLELGGRSGPSSRTSSPIVKLERIGEEIVNSISIHKLVGEGEGAEDEVVAVLTNNDKTVRIYSLSHGLEDAVLDLPFPMNHATISPDGQMLVAVGDYHQAFFFERVKKQVSPSSKPDTRARAAPPEWRNFCVSQLHLPPTSTTTGYFSTAWSPSGNLCAVGSECGYITVFDTELLQHCEYGEDAIVQVICSTRPDSTHGPGAVRTMCFSPQPWDLLIWSEDQARVCVADLREGLLARQVLILDPKEENLSKVEVPLVDIDTSQELARLQELSQEAEFLNRYRRALATPSDERAFHVAQGYMEAAAERRRAQLQAGEAEAENDPNGFSAEERSLLDALRTRDHRSDSNRERERLGTIPRSINYSAGTANLGDNRRSGLLVGGEFPSLTEARSALQERGGLPSLGTLRDFLRAMPGERNADIDLPPFQPRRQASRYLPNPATTANERNTTSDPWRTIEAAMSRSPEPTSASASRPAGGAGTGPSNPPTQRADPLVEMSRLRQLARARERVRSMQAARGLGDDYGVGLFRRAVHAGRWNPGLGVRTAGLAMSKDGRKLWAGTEEGIFEFEIDVRGRKGWGAVQPR
ncbi:uncharacterized protein K452DRAFT_306142 [Aplosporella prunicola CBS 121167]|uniref:DUF2415 domain-containing protein n=1 Tax=Aplosporella prunicola CBS 121167 TaxID=1176127 RepID=A0A6A6BQZ3_9PEZI|nr:uncharacterized protein K452DRAFT_306142 [Aplosporella prunicola CBS 121167]KAF2145227.1 hypothetical protein K452DRAFT_306142 [Aplosporella prunicola CBS 121167]